MHKHLGLTSGGNKITSKKSNVKVSKKRTSKKKSVRGAAGVITKTQTFRKTSSESAFFTSPYSIETKVLDVVDKCEDEGTTLSTWKKTNIKFMSKTPEVFWAKLIADILRLVGGKLLKLRVNRVEKVELTETGGSKKIIHGGDLGKDTNKLALTSNAPKKYESIKIHLSDKITFVRDESNDFKQDKSKVKSKK